MKNVTADLEKLPGLNGRNWAMEGAIFGVVAGLGLSLITTLIAIRMRNITVGMIFAVLVPSVGAIVGSMFGKRWRYLLLRDSGRTKVNMLRWQIRSIIDGSVAGVFSFGICTLLGLIAESVIYTKNLFEGIFFVLIVSSLFGAIVGGFTFGILGLTYALALGQGRRSGLLLGLVFVSGPTIVFLLRAILSA